MRQILVHVSDLPKKPTIGDKTKPLSIQKVRPDNEQHGVTRFEYFVVSFGIRKCHSPYVLLHFFNTVIILLETSDRCKIYQRSTSQ
jgi:hypothetical protein